MSGNAVRDPGELADQLRNASRLAGEVSMQVTNAGLGEPVGEVPCLEKGARPAALFASQHKHERLQITPRSLHHQGKVCSGSLHCARHARRRQVGNRCPHGPVRIVTNGVRRLLD